MTAVRVLFVALLALAASAAWAAPAPLPKTNPVRDNGSFGRLKKELLSHGYRLEDVRPHGANFWVVMTIKEGECRGERQEFRIEAPDRLAALRDLVDGLRLPPPAP